MKSKDFAPIDAVAAPAYKRYIFEGNFPYQKIIKITAIISFGIAILLAVVYYLLQTYDKAYLQLQAYGISYFQLANVLAEGIVTFLVISLLAFFAATLNYFFPLVAYQLFRPNVPRDVRVLGKKIARSWDKYSPQFFKGFEDPIRKNIYYPGIISVSPMGNQLKLIVEVPKGALTGGFIEYCKAAVGEIESRLNIRVTYVSSYENGDSDKPENTAMFVLTPTDYSLMSRKVDLSY